MTACTICGQPTPGDDRDDQPVCAACDMANNRPYAAVLIPVREAPGTPRHIALYVVWGNASITLEANGNLTIAGFPSLDAAAQGFWRAVARWAPGGVRVTLPEGYGEEEPPA
jgi:hypothetical protein